MRSPRYRRLLAPVMCTGLLTTTVPLAVSATASPVLQLTDFQVESPTAEQGADITALRNALVARGIDDTGIGVFALPTIDGMTTIITRSPDEFAVAGGPIFEVTRVESALPARPALSNPLDGHVTTAGLEAKWVRSNADCDIYSTKGFARTQCFEITTQDGDADPKRSFWQYTAEATGHSKGWRDMDRMWVERKPAPSSARQEFDGIPEPKEARNKADNCVQKTEGVSIGSGAPVQVGFTKSWSRMTCETYRPKMYDDEGHWATIWKGNPDVGPKDTRHVMFVMPVKTAQGALPSWVRLNGQHTR